MIDTIGRVLKVKQVMNPFAKATGLSFQVSRSAATGAEHDRLHDGNPDRFTPNPEDFTNQGFSWFNLLSSLVNGSLGASKPLALHKEECLRTIIPLQGRFFYGEQVEGRTVRLRNVYYVEFYKATRGWGCELEFRVKTRRQFTMETHRVAGVGREGWLGVGGMGTALWDAWRNAKHVVQALRQLPGEFELKEG